MAFLINHKDTKSTKIFLSDLCVFVVLSPTVKRSPMFGIFKRKDKAKETTAQQPATVTPAQTEVKPPATSVIKIYTIALDQSCKMTRDMLADRGLKYEEIDVTGN